MTDDPVPTNGPDLQFARRLLEQSLVRLTHGSRKLAALVGVLLGLAQIVPVSRLLGWTSFSQAGEVLKSLLFDLSGLAIAMLIVWAALPWVLNLIYRPLLERGTIMPVVIISGPEPMHQRFTGQSTQLFMMRNALGALEALIGGWLPPLAVNFRPAHRKGDIRTGMFYADEELMDPGHAYALIDTKNQLKCWLIRKKKEVMP